MNGNWYYNSDNLRAVASYPHGFILPWLMSLQGTLQGKNAFF
jgi:hypothetical protein